MEPGATDPIPPIHGGHEMPYPAKTSEPALIADPQHRIIYRRPVEFRYSRMNLSIIDFGSGRKTAYFRRLPDENAGISKNGALRECGTVLYDVD